MHPFRFVRRRCILQQASNSTPHTKLTSHMPPKKKKNSLKDAKKEKSKGAGKQQPVRWDKLQREKKLMQLERQAGYSGKAVPGVRPQQFLSQREAPWPNDQELYTALTYLVGEEGADEWIEQIEAGEDPVKYANTIHLWFLHYFGNKYMPNMADVSEDEGDEENDEEEDWPSDDEDYEYVYDNDDEEEEEGELLFQ